MTYSNIENLNNNLKALKAEVEALNIIIETTKHLDHANGFKFDVYEALNDQMEILYSKRIEANQKIGAIKIVLDILAKEV